MKRKQNTNYWHIFESRYSHYSQIPNRWKGGKLPFCQNLPPVSIYYDPLTSPPPLNLWFPSWANIPILYPLRTSENRTYGFWLPTTIRNLIGRKRTTFKTFHLIINCINQIVMLILNSKDIDQFFLHSLIQMLMSALLLMTSKNPWMTVL